MHAAIVLLQYKKYDDQNAMLTERLLSKKTKALKSMHSINYFLKRIDLNLMGIIFPKKNLSYISRNQSNAYILS